MSRFFSQDYATLTPYVPGEQPKGQQKFVKLNSNESPYPPSPLVIQRATEAAGTLNYYNDAASRELRQTLADFLGVQPENVLPTNGSDEILYFAFLAFCDAGHPMAFPDISYSFYPVFAKTTKIPTHIIPLKDDFSIDYRDYCGLNENIVIANPNAPTCQTLSLTEIEEIVRTNPDNVVIIDEAYVDFGGESAVPLTKKYDNLLVTQTFSKSRSLAGGRLGIGIGSAELIADLNTLRNSFNPFNVNSVTQAAGIAAIESNDYYMENCRRIMEAREWTYGELLKLGYAGQPSKTNFLFVKKPGFSGEELARLFREGGVLVRYLGGERTADYIRVSIGTREEMQTFINVAAGIAARKG